jgi:hypothetical protein
VGTNRPAKQPSVPATRGVDSKGDALDSCYRHSCYTLGWRQRPEADTASKAGVAYAVSGAETGNQGEANLTGEKDVSIKITFQVGEAVDKLSVSRTRGVTGGSMVICEVATKAIKDLADDELEKGLIMKTRTRARDEEKEKGVCMFVYRMTITREKKKWDPNA